MCIRLLRGFLIGSGMASETINWEHRNVNYLIIGDQQTLVGLLRNKWALLSSNHLLTQFNPPPTLYQQDKREQRGSLAGLVVSLPFRGLYSCPPTVMPIPLRWGTKECAYLKPVPSSYHAEYCRILSPSGPKPAFRAHKDFFPEGHNGSPQRGPRHGPLQQVAGSQTAWTCWLQQLYTGMQGHSWCKTDLGLER